MVMITRLDFLVRLARHEPRLATRAQLMDDTKQRDEKRNEMTTDTPSPRNEIFREAIAIIARETRKLLGTQAPVS